jgi:hypothetical protein
VAHANFKQHKQHRRIIATARLLNNILWHMLTKKEPFDEVGITDPKLFRKSMETQVAVFNVA